MRFKLTVAIVFLSIQAGVFAQGSKSLYINYEYEGVLPGKTLPNGVIELGGSLIGDIDADPVHSIAHTQDRRTTMLWLVVSTGKDAKGITGWKVIDVLSFPMLSKTQYLFVSGDPAIYCRKNGNEIQNLVGVGRIDRKNWRLVPSRLWIADLNTKQFSQLDLAGVKCEYSEP